MGCNCSSNPNKDIDTPHSIQKNSDASGNSHSKAINKRAVSPITENKIDKLSRAEKRKDEESSSRRDNVDETISEKSFESKIALKQTGRDSNNFNKNESQSSSKDIPVFKEDPPKNNVNDKQAKPLKTSQKTAKIISSENIVNLELPLTVLVIQKGGYIYEKVRVKYSSAKSKMEVLENIREELKTFVDPQLSPENILLFNKNKLVLDSLEGVKDSQERIHIVIDLASSSKDFTGSKELRFQAESLKRLKETEPSKFRPYINESFKESPLYKYYQLLGEFENIKKTLFSEIDSAKASGLGELSGIIEKAYETETRMSALYDEFLVEAIDGIYEFLNSQATHNILFLEGMYSSRNCKFLHKNTVIVRLRDSVEESYKKHKTIATMPRVLEKLGLFEKAIFPFSAAFRVSAEEIFLAFSLLPTTAKRFCYGYLLEQTIINNDFACDRETNLSPAEITQLKALVLLLQKTFRYGVTGVIEKSTKKKKRVLLPPGLQIFKTEQGLNNLPGFNILNMHDLNITLTKTNYPTPVTVRPELYILQEGPQITLSKGEIFESSGSVIARDEEDDSKDKNVEEFDEERRILEEFYKNKNDEDDMLSSINSNKSVVGFAQEKEDWQTRTKYKKDLQEHLEHSVLNKIASDLASGKLSRVAKLGETTKIYLHERGVNLRYLGLIFKRLRLQSPNHDAAVVIQNEIIARTIKNIVVHCIINLKEHEKFIVEFSRDKVIELIELIKSSTDDNVIEREKFWEKCRVCFSFEEDVNLLSEEALLAINKRAEELVLNKVYLNRKKKILLLKTSTTRRMTESFLIRLLLEMDAENDREKVREAIEWMNEHYEKAFVERLIMPLFSD